MTTTLVVQAQLPALELDALAHELLDARLPCSLLAGELDDNRRFLSSRAQSLRDSLAIRLDSLDEATILQIAADMHPVYPECFFDAQAASQHIQADMVAMATYWLMHVIQHRLRADDMNPLVPFKGSRVWSRFPDIQRHTTDEDLVVLTAPLRALPNGIRIGNAVLHYHEWIGPSRSTSPECDIISFLIHHADSTPNCVSIAVDGRGFAVNNRFLSMVMEDHWRGRPLSRSDLDNPHATGVTVHTAPDLSTSQSVAVQCITSGIHRVEALWKHKEGIKTFEIEEILVDDTRRPRYLHAEYDLKSRSFRHIDGAIMLYAERDRADRGLDSCVLPRTPRAARKPKLFRVDGCVSIDDWSMMVSLFFRGNPLVSEYLAGHTGPSVIHHSLA